MRLHTSAIALVVGVAFGACTPEAPPPPKVVPGPPPAAATEVRVTADVIDDGVHVRVLRDGNPESGVTVTLVLEDGSKVSTVTDRLGAATLVPSLAQLFASAASGAATVRAHDKEHEVNLAPMLRAAAAQHRAEWAEFTRERDARDSKADHAITFVGPIYRDKSAEAFVESCTPTGPEVCGDGIDNDCNGRYDDAACGYHSGVLQFTATWQGNADVALHVIGPDGVEVSRERPTNDKLGLVLDRSSGNIENAYVTADKAPITGTYQAWIELDEVGSDAREAPIPVTFSGRIGTRSWHTLVKLAPIAGASYQIAVPLGSDQDRDSVTDSLDACPTTAGCWFDDVKYRGCPDVDQDAVPDAIDACPSEAGLTSSDAKENGCPLVFGDASVTNDGVRIKSRIEFAFGRAELRPSSKTTLENVARAILAHPSKVDLIAVDGHTDEVGSEADNVVLSQNRANAVREALVKLGVPEAKLTARGFGETKPRADNDTPRGRQLNRRVEFLMLEPRGTVSTCWSVPTANQSPASTQQTAGSKAR